ncbi:hypothetical protein LINPERPRIM_LOCUS35392 [Linum perenne]
MMVMFLCLCF